MYLKLVTDSKITFVNAFAMADSILVQTVGGIIDLIQNEGLINSDFADVTSVMQNSGTMHMGLCRASGADRANKIYDQIWQSKLLDTTIEGAKAVLLCITASSAAGLDEVEILCAAVREAVHPEANIIFGMREDDTLGDEMQAMIIATGLDT